MSRLRSRVDIDSNSRAPGAVSSPPRPVGRGRVSVFTRLIEKAYVLIGRARAAAPRIGPAGVVGRDLSSTTRSATVHRIRLFFRMYTASAAVDELKNALTSIAPLTGRFRTSAHRLIRD